MMRAMNGVEHDVTITEGLREAQVDDALRVLWQAFSRKLRIGFRSVDDFLGLFRDSVRREVCLVATAPDGAILGLLALQTRSKEFFRLRAGALLGRFRPWRVPLILFNVLLLSFEAKADELVVDMVAVTPASRGLGVGTMLLEAAEAKGRAGGYARMSLSVLGDNTGAQRLYERQGYRRVRAERGALVRFVVGSDSVYRMEKRLDTPATAPH